MSTDYAEYVDAVNRVDRLMLSTGTGGIKLTLKWEESIRKFWISREDAEDLRAMLNYLLNKGDLR